MDKRKKILVVGLGIIGGSICRSLTRAGEYVAGYDINEKSTQIALENGYIREIGKNFEDYAAVFLAVPPSVTIRFLSESRFRDGAFVADICGVKKPIEDAVYAVKRSYRYIGLHPMAGRETSGIESSSTTLFDGANLVVAISPKTEQSAIAEALEFAEEMRFGRITRCTSEEHDRKIALTSQLAHIVSNAYVKSPEAKRSTGFTGGSFQDMTRIASVDENVWSELYFFNKDFLLDELNGLISRLEEYRSALSCDDEEGLKKILREGKMCKKTIKKRAKVNVLDE